MRSMHSKMLPALSAVMLLMAGTVSGGFLRHYGVTFDFTAMRLILTQ